MHEYCIVMIEVHEDVVCCHCDYLCPGLVPGKTDRITIPMVCDRHRLLATRYTIGWATSDATVAQPVIVPTPDNTDHQANRWVLIQSGDTHHCTPGLVAVTVIVLH
jgi:hypothetical protein